MVKLYYGINLNSNVFYVFKSNIESFLNERLGQSPSLFFVFKF
ncbi:hypothetical protein PT2222_180110 [Paraburkholderia tropica]